MARSQASDYLQGMRFHAEATSVDGSPRLTVPGNPQAGFSNIGTPSATSEVTEYREGTFVFTQKYPGLPTVEDVTLSRGVARLDSSFWDWMRVVLEGSGEYRADLDIKHFHRDTSLVRPFPTNGSEANLTRIDITQPARIYHCRNCFPSNHKVAADLDGTSSEISVMEITITLESFEVEEVPVE